MSYIPKSKYEILKSSGNEYKDPQTNKPYVGPYILTSDGAYIGNDITRKGPKLIPLTNTPSNKIVFTPNVTRYNLANSGKNLNFINNTKSIIATKTQPTEKDYQKGYYTRYFVKKNNEINVYFEVDKNTYKSISQKSIEYDYVLYTADKIRWALEGDVIKTNSKILLQKERTYPNVSSLFSNLNEFQKFLYSDGSELVYKDDPNRKYVGYYHIHPNKGPMEGKVHVSTPHASLEFINVIEDIQPQPQPQQTGYIAPEAVQEQVTPFTGGGGY